MMKAATLLLVAVGLLAGCAPPDQGAPIPERKPVSEQQLSNMPPQARSQAEAAAKAGSFQEQRMKEMVEAQRRAGH